MLYFFKDTSRAKKDGELDGQDYHFITRVQFESDILARKFVEHGEYEKAYYGNIYIYIYTCIKNNKYGKTSLQRIPCKKEKSSLQKISIAPVRFLRWKPLYYGNIFWS